MKRYLPLLIGLLFLVPTTASSESNPTPEATVSQTSGVVLPVVKRDFLLNGLQVILLEQGGANTVTARLRINSGSLFDLAGKGGLADLTAGMLLRGGGGFTAKNITEVAEQAGLTINIQVNWDATDIVMRAPAEGLETIFDLLGKMVITPTFDEKELEALKGLRTAEIKSQPSDNADTVLLKSVETIYGSHPYGRPQRGTVESLAKVVRADLLYYHNRFYLANNAVLLISGDVNMERLTPLARSKLGAWKKGEKVPATFRPPEPLMARKVMLLDRPDARMSLATIAQPGISRRAQDYFAAWVMSELLGERVARLADGSKGTSVRLDLHPRLLQGPLFLTAQAQTSELPAVLNLLVEEMGSLGSAQIAIEQVEAAKSRILANLAQRLQSNEGMAEVLLDIELYGLGRDYLVTYANRINAVSAADVQRAAQSYLKPQSIAVLVAGPAKQLDASLKSFGTVTVMP